MAGTRSRLLEGALETLRSRGIAGTSARSIAAAAGVNQALVFYHFGSVGELLTAAVQQGAERQAAAYQDRFSSATSLRDVLELGRSLHADQREAGHLAVLTQMLAGAQADRALAPATAAGLDQWAAQIEAVLERILGGGPLAGKLDPGGLARLAAAVFIGLALYGGVDPGGAGRALAALERLAAVAAGESDQAGLRG
ncbi:MAG TPA: TetR/AcrR family transcriptional regulator [Streptosporangiaceae bacterium]|jgi:AcrR family transcriptional regulator